MMDEKFARVDVLVPAVKNRGDEPHDPTFEKKEEPDT